VVPLGGWSQHQTYDFDGVFAIQSGPRESARGYAALFRTGVVEAVDTDLLQTRSYAEGVPHFIQSAPVEGAIIVGTRRFLAVSLLGVKGCWLAVDDQRRVGVFCPFAIARSARSA
jgi:hypothetical protein